MGHSVFFSIEVEATVPNGVITAIRVQDLITNEFFNWDNGVWDKKPKVAAGTTVYIAAAALNNGDAGYMTMKIIKSGTVIATKREYVAAGASIGIESSVSGQNPVIDANANMEVRVEDV